MTAFLLWFLATIDAAFIGYREAAGRSALINKRKYYRKAIIRGLLFGQFAVFLATVFILAALFLSPQPQVLTDDLLLVGKRLLIVYIPFALLIFLAFAIRAFSSVDIKSITSTVIFGPFTLLRPLVAVGGMVYGLIAVPKMVIFLLGALILLLMLLLETVMNQCRKRNLFS